MVIYVAGVGRSGSTLVGQLLGQLPGFVMVGELVARFWAERRTVLLCGCGLPVQECPFWTAVVRRAYGGWDTPEIARAEELRGRLANSWLLPLLLLLPWQPRAVRRRTDDLARHALRLFEAVAAVSGARVVVDTSKDPIFALVLRQAFGSRLRLLHLVRNPNGVAFSWTKLVSKPLLGEPGAQMSRYRPGRIAFRWLRRNAMLELVRSCTDAVVVRYEDVARSPTAELARVRGLAGMDDAEPAAFLGQDSAQLAQTHTWGGNPMRFRSGPLSIRLDEQWRRELPPRQRAIVTGVTAPLLLRYGYRREPEPVASAGEPGATS